MTIPVVFFGSPQFAVPSLRALSSDARFRVALVVTQPDRPSGRGRRTIAPPVKLAAGELNLPIWQPETLREPEAIETLRTADAQIFVVAAYGEIFRRAVLELAPHGCLNIHPSLLPLYRGSAPVQAAILNGDDETGVSIIRLVRRLDSGAIVAQVRTSLSGNETAGELSQRLAEMAGEMLPDVAARWVAGEIQAVPQDEDGATYTRELRKDDGRVDWRRSAAEIERQVRAMNPWPRAWGVIENKRVALLRVIPTKPTAETTGPGQVWHSARRVVVSTGAGAVELASVQPEGRKEMSGENWFRGARLGDGAHFDVDDSAFTQDG